MIMKDILILALVMALIVNLAGVVLGYPYSEYKFKMLAGYNTGIMVVAVFYLVFSKRS